MQYETSSNQLNADSSEQVSRAQPTNTTNTPAPAARSARSGGRAGSTPALAINVRDNPTTRRRDYLVDSTAVKARENQQETVGKRNGEVMAVRRGTNSLPKRGPGRPKGSKNSTSKEAAEAVLRTFDKLGGEKWLEQLAKDQPALFVRCFQNLLPRDMSISGQLNLGLDDVLSRMKS